jgi:glyoxylase-like metal-dependent hydrolase (beta-lactamase superfamily II)
MDGEEELFPDLQLHIVNGHTFGQQLVRLTEGDQSLLYAGDLLPMTSHVPEAWIMGYDLQPLITLEEKQSILQRAVQKRDVVFFEHDAEADAALIVLGPKGFHVSDAGKLQDVLAAAGS